MGRDAQRVERVDVLGEAVTDALALSLERAEESIPDDEDPAMVPVQILLLHTVVDSVM